MDDLADDLLVEILCRLPCKSAVKCKSISKRFLALISHRSFIERYFHQHHHQLMSQDQLERQWHFNPLSKRRILMSFQPNNITLGQYESWSHLKSCFIVGCSNGLLLYRTHTTYFVCNPVTKQFFQLPPPPPPPSARDDRDYGNKGLDGFICEPNYLHHMEGRNRFRVVRFSLYHGRWYESDQFEMMVFCSETGQWNTKVVSCIKGSSFKQEAMRVPATIAHGGKLYFWGKGSVLVYDPFDKEEVECDCHVIEFPSGSYPFVASTGHVGVSCGKIRLCVVFPLLSVSVWELEAESRSWCLVQTSVVVAEKEVGRVFGHRVRVRVRAIHPHHGDVVLLQWAHRLFFWNLKTNQVHTAGVGHHDLQVISLDLPCWPTPIPSIVGS